MFNRPQPNFYSLMQYPQMAQRMPSNPLAAPAVQPQSQQPSTSSQMAGLAMQALPFLLGGGGGALTPDAASASQQALLGGGGPTMQNASNMAALMASGGQSMGALPNGSLLGGSGGGMMPYGNNTFGAYSPFLASLMRR